MGYLLIAISLALSVVAFRMWLRAWTLWHRRKGFAQDISDANMADWPGLIAFLLPRTARRVWNTLALGLCWLLLGIPHLLALSSFFGSGERSPWLYAHYLWTLAYWLALLAFPALMLSAHRLARRQTAPTAAP